MGTAFISYSHTDSAVADNITQVLDGLGITYFRDVKNITWGDPITESVRQGLQEAAAIIVIVSPGSLKSQWVAYEVGFGTGRRKRVLPYLTHPALDVPGFMSDLSYITSLDQMRDYFTNNQDWHVPQEAQSQENAVYKATLSELQADYLKEISKPRNEGSIYAGIDDRTGRDVAPYQEALEVFQEFGLMRFTDDAYKITPKGWSLVDQLWALAIADVLEVDKYANETEIAEKVGLTDGETELEELRRHIDTMKQNGLVNSVRSNKGVSAALTQEGATYRKHRPVHI